MNWSSSRSSLGFLFIHSCVIFVALVDSTKSQVRGQSVRHQRRYPLEIHSPLEESLRHFRNVPIPSQKSFIARTNDYNSTAAEIAAGAKQVVECHLQSWPEAHESARGLISITMRHDLSPAKAAQFVALAASGYYDGVFIFRVLKGYLRSGCEEAAVILNEFYQKL